MKTNSKRFVSIGLALAGLAFNLALVQPVRADGFYGDSDMNDARAGHTSTALPTVSLHSQLVVAGGYDGSGDALASAEVYTLTDSGPAVGNWAYTGSLNTPRYFHTATLLPNGKILVAGGNDQAWGVAATTLASAELYDPSSGTWSYTGSMNYARQQHTATLLPNGLVLVAGGDDGTGNAVTSAELYNPATGTWSVTGGMNYAREGQAATMLPDGTVLVSGGSTIGIGSNPPGSIPPAGGSLTNAELYIPSYGTWVNIHGMCDARAYHTATLMPNGLVLVAGGMDAGGNALASMEIYDPSAGNWTLNEGEWLNTARYAHTANLLPDGRLLVSGGVDSYGSGINSGELCYQDHYIDIDWTEVVYYTGYALQSSVGGRGWLAGTLLSDNYNCYVVVTGGDAGGASVYPSTDLYNDLINTNDLYLTLAGFINLYPAGFWTATDWMNASRSYHTATMLTNGLVLVAGGDNSSAPAELYNPGTGLWADTGFLNDDRTYHTATLLTNGEVLVAGGGDSSPTVTAGAELYNPVAGTWSYTGSRNDGRFFHTATLLTNGLVLVAGGVDNSFNVLTNAELYNPVTGVWSYTGTMNSPRYNHTATLLTNGLVLVAGGANDSEVLASAELYNPATGTWSYTGSMNSPRTEHTATSLPRGSLLRTPFDRGEVLVAGGIGNWDMLTASAEIYFPTTGTWTNTGSMNIGRSDHTATWCGNMGIFGMVLVTGGQPDHSSSTDSVEFYDVNSGTWTMTSPMDGDRRYHTATWLPGNQVLVTGGASTIIGSVPFAEVFGQGEWW